MPATQEASPEIQQPHVQAARWPLIGRIGFRLAFCYFMLYLFCNGNVTVFSPVDRLPWLGGIISGWFATPFHPLTQWIGRRFFHITGIAGTWHGGGSGDTAQNWILLGVFFTLAVMATVVWSVLDRRRAAYPLLYAWLRFTLRLMLGVAMLVYGFAKVFPFQMQPPTLAVLNEPFGQMSPDSLLWSMLGAVPVYEMICGWTEVLAGVLLLVRRTALAGALLTAFVMTNVLLYNLFYDVPVKQFAGHLVLFALFLILGDAEQLYRFFVLNHAAEPKGVWVPPASRAGVLQAMKIVEVCYLLLAIGTSVFMVQSRWQAFEAAQRPSPLTGAWTVVSAAPSAVKTAEGRAWTHIYFDNMYRAMVRDTSGQLWRYNLKYDAAKHTIDMANIGTPDRFSWKAEDADHLTLVSRAANSGAARTSDAAPVTLQLTREPTAKSYVLYDRGFHLVNEWGYEH